MSIEIRIHQKAAGWPQKHCKELLRDKEWQSSGLTQICEGNKSSESRMSLLKVYPTMEMDASGSRSLVALNVGIL